MATRKRAELFGDENWIEVEPGYWENYGLSDDIPSIAEDGGRYIVQFNGAESMADDMYTQTFDSLEDAVGYAEDMLASGRLAGRKDFIAGYMAGIRHRKKALTITEYPEGWEEDPTPRSTHRACTTMGAWASCTTTGRGTCSAQMGNSRTRASTCRTASRRQWSATSTTAGSSASAVALSQD